MKDGKFRRLLEFIFGRKYDKSGQEWLDEIKKEVATEFEEERQKKEFDRLTRLPTKRQVLIPMDKLDGLYEDRAELKKLQEGATSQIELLQKNSRPPRSDEVGLVAMNNQQQHFDSGSPDPTECDIKYPRGPEALPDQVVPIELDPGERDLVKYFREYEEPSDTIMEASNYQPLYLVVRLEIQHEDGTSISSKYDNEGCVHVKFPIDPGALSPSMFAANAHSLCVHHLNPNLQALQMRALQMLGQGGIRKIQLKHKDGLIG